MNQLISGMPADRENRLTLSKTTWREIIADSHQRVTCYIADTLLGRYFDMALQNPKSDVVFALHNLKYQGLKLGILSNTNSREISTWFRSPLSGVFETTCFSCNIGFETPSPEAYNHILNRLGVSAGSSVYVSGGTKGTLKGV